MGESELGRVRWTQEHCMLHFADKEQATYTKVANRHLLKVGSQEHQAGHPTQKLL